MTIINTISAELGKLDPDYLSKKYILAVSGGVDSMVLLDCLNNLNLHFEVAHFNFQLRAEASNADEALVRAFCLNNKIPFNRNTADTNSYATENGLSIQEAARDLRYKWFMDLLQEKKADYIITGHHADDSVETFFINLLRGSGIKGLCGISNKQQIIRPLLPVSRTEIEKYASAYGISFRNDSSNESLKYKRNFIRKKIIPELNKNSDSASSSILKSINHLSQVNTYLEKKLQEDLDKIVSFNEKKAYINTRNPIEDIVLYSVLSNFGFNDSHVKSIQADTKSIGKKHYSSTHELLVDRSQLIIQEISEHMIEAFEIASLGDYNAPFSFSLKQVEKPQNLRTEKNTLLLDADTIQFPLQLRKWKEGDWFIPYGMTGKKKLSDFFIDEKISQFEKENTWLLISEKEIVWIVNHRSDDRYKVSNDTKKTLQFVTY